MGILLAIDTAAPRLQLALLRDDDRPETLVEDMTTGQAERLFPALDELLARVRAKYADLTITSDAVKRLGPAKEP